MWGSSSFKFSELAKKAREQADQIHLTVCVIHLLFKHKIKKGGKSFTG